MFAAFGPAFDPEQRDEADLAEVLLVVALDIAPRDASEALVVDVAVRQDEPATDRELIEQRARRAWRAGGHGDRLVRRAERPAERTVAVVHVDVVVAQPGEALGRNARQLLDALDGVDLAHQRAEDRGRVARAGADLEHALLALELQRLHGHRDDVGLRDRLAGADRQRRVVVGMRAELLGHELLARHGAEHGQHQRVDDVAPAELVAHHALPSRLAGQQGPGHALPCARSPTRTMTHYPATRRAVHIPSNPAAIPPASVAATLAT